MVRWRRISPPSTGSKRGWDADRSPRSFQGPRVRKIHPGGVLVEGSVSTKRETSEETRKFHSIFAGPPILPHIISISSSSRSCSSLAGADIGYLFTKETTDRKREVSVHIGVLLRLVWLKLEGTGLDEFDSIYHGHLFSQKDTYAYVRATAKFFLGTSRHHFGAGATIVRQHPGGLTSESP